MFTKASKYFSKTPGMFGGPKNLYEVVEAPECLPKLLNIFQRLLKCLEVLNNFYEFVEASKYFSKTSWVPGDPKKYF